MILRALAVGPLATNCYILGGEEDRRGLVIDPGGEAGPAEDGRDVGGGLVGPAACGGDGCFKDVLRQRVRHASLCPTPIPSVARGRGICLSGG